MEVTSDVKILNCRRCKEALCYGIKIKRFTNFCIWEKVEQKGKKQNISNKS